MATLTPINAAFPLDDSDNVYLSFTTDTTQVLSRALDNVDEHFLTMDSLSWTVEYSQEFRVDDTLDLRIRIVNGATILAAATAGGNFQTVAANVTNTADETAGPTPFAYVNTTADKATWNGASVELEQVFTATMMADGCRIRVDWVEFTGEFTPSVQTFDVVHTTDIGVGLFLEHTTDLLVSEFSAPTATGSGGSLSRGTKLAIDSQGQVWMVGISSPLTIRLWQGGTSGPGLWQLHEFAHGSGIVRDVAMAIIEDRIHVVYSYHSGSTQRQAHIVWDSTAESWTNNGAFGPSESHSDSTVSIRNSIGIAATSDGELVAISYLHNYVSFAGSSAYRLRARLIRSTSEVFPTSSGVLYREFYGDNIFDPPGNIGHSRLYAAGEHVVVETTNASYAFFTSSSTLTADFPTPEDGHSLPALPVVRGPAPNNLRQPFAHGDRHYWLVNNDPFSYEATVGYISAATDGVNELLFDDGKIIEDYSDLGTNHRGQTLLVDEKGRIGAAIYMATGTGTKGRLILSNGIGWFTYDFDCSVGSPGEIYRSQQIAGRAYNAWHHSPSAAWTYVGTTIPYWQEAHTTDLVVSNKPVAIHTTDLVVSSGIWGFPYRRDSDQNPRQVWFEHDGSHYIVTSAAQAGSFDSIFSLYIFRADDSRNPGSLLATLRIGDLPTTSQVSRLKAWDVVHVDGVLHFLLAGWISTRAEFHHSEYDIDTDTWTHNGAFHNGTALAHSSDDAVALAVRGNGDLVALFHLDNDLGSPTQGGFHYALNTGTGFGSGVLIVSPSWTTTNTAASMAIDGNDVHFMNHTIGGNHVHLDGSNTLGPLQGTFTGSSTLRLAGVARIYPSSKPMVYNGRMYWPGFIQNSTQLGVVHAETGLDEPTWTQDTVTSNVSTFYVGFLAGLNGIPTLIYLKAGSWKIWKASLQGGSWVEQDTGQYLPVDEHDKEPTNLTSNRNAWYLSTIDANNYVTIWWLRTRTTADLDTPGGVRWYPWRFNLNPLVIHTTDVITVEGSQVVVHTTDVLAMVTVEHTHTTDVVAAELGGPVAIEHTTDVRATARPQIVHTTDVYAVLLLNHTTDIVIAPKAHEISATVLLNFEMTVTLEQGNKPAATGLGVPRQGVQAPRIYNPKRKMVKR
jgi:hypothetical protein